jgi:hypothetical protein
MRTLKLHFPDDALLTLETFLKKTKEARTFRRAQAVRAVVTGQRLQTVSDTLHFPYAALRKWVYTASCERRLSQRRASRVRMGMRRRLEPRPGAGPGSWGACLRWI